MKEGSSWEEQALLRELPTVLGVVLPKRERERADTVLSWTVITWGLLFTVSLPFLCYLFMVPSVNKGWHHLSGLLLQGLWGHSPPTLAGHQGLQTSWKFVFYFYIRNPEQCHMAPPLGSTESEYLMETGSPHLILDLSSTRGEIPILNINYINTQYNNIYCFICKLHIICSCYIGVHMCTYVYVCKFLHTQEDSL